MIGILIAIVLAAVAYWICVALGLPAIVALIAAVLVLLAGVPSGGFGFGSRFGGRRGTYKRDSKQFRRAGPAPGRVPARFSLQHRLSSAAAVQPPRRRQSAGPA